MFLEVFIISQYIIKCQHSVHIPIVRSLTVLIAAPSSRNRITPAPAATPAPAVGGPIPEGAITVKAPMPGKISALKAEAGKAVKRGDIILVLEAMKMQNDITATADGTLHEIRVNPGDNVKTGDVLAVIVK